MYNRSDILKNIKILDLSRIFTGPFCTQILSDLGADVIKVESPNGDDTRYWGPPFLDENLSTYFASLNRNKQTITLDFKNKDDYIVLSKLVEWADVVVENYRPGVSSKLKVNFDALSEINSQIVYLSITGFGSSGPYRDHSSYDIIAQSEGGIMGITGSENGEIAKVGVPVGDIAAGMYGAIGILAALRKRDQTKQPQLVETDLFGSLTSWLTYQSMNSAFIKNQQPRPLGTSHPNIVPYQSFQCSDEKWISIAIGNQKLWQLFKQVLKDQRLEDNNFNTNKYRVINKEELVSILTEIFRSQSSSQWYKSLIESNIPVGKVRTIQEVHHHPQIKYNNQIQIVRTTNKNVPYILTPLAFNSSEQMEVISPSYQNQDREQILSRIGFD